MSDALSKAIAGNRESALARAIAAPDYLTVYGSKLYGTSTPESDHDERGFTVPPFEYLAGLCRFDQRVETAPDDRIVWSLARFVAMLIKGDPQAYEMLFAPESLVLACSDAGRRVRDARSLFACTRFHRRITGYAQSEWRKVRGVTLEPIARTRDEASVIEDIRAVFSPDKAEMDEVIRLLFLNHGRREIPATRKLGAKRKAQVDRFGFCVSSASHSVRLIGELEEMLTGDGGITFPRSNAEWLLAVKQGRVPFGEVEREFEDTKARVEAAAETTSLPEKPATAAIERLYHSAVAAKLLADERVREYASLASLAEGAR